ncbi:MAG: Transcriptional regulator [uncultured Campylobacterales bacterium]|uniref:Transcriptional regulator n=1 Tax=uncultured Campylobacterales bacterium TaxID=352960 RepID=A0A6S6STU6_9BACT|nr:MAG: Transcriptional regulator [uncultured Campylobacterales bacterium]
MFNYNEDFFLNLIKNNENEILEYKEAKNSFDSMKLGKYFSALSNEANLSHQKCAWLVLGINDNKDIVGTSFRSSEKKLYNLKTEIAEQTNNRITLKSINVVLIKNKRVIFFEIPPALEGIPTSYKGHYYGREYESLQPLSLEEMDRIRTQGNLKDWSKDICQEASIQDLSKQAIQKAKELYQIKNPKLKKEIQNWDNTTFLNKAKICIKGQITNTAIILLGKSESEYLISPAVAKISWILKDINNTMKDYEHFSCPFILNIDKVYKKIRNLKYRYIKNSSLFPEEVDSYHPYIIREALNNCIAHQDYTLGSKISLVENENSTLIFNNAGTFIPQYIKNVLTSNAPEAKYRNSFLTQAMVNLGMIDTVGSGILKMFNIQKEKYFPLPEYSFEDNKVEVLIEGKILDINYATKLAQIPDLSIDEIFALDKLQKNRTIDDEEIKLLKAKKLIEGKKPNFHISAKVAKHTNKKEEYIQLRGINDEYAKKMILDYIKKFGEARKSDLFKLLATKLPDALNQDQKNNKIKNYLQDMKKNNLIKLEGKFWKKI